MNKKEVSEFLGISTRLVERYASEGRLGEITYIRGKTGKQAEYNREAVESLKIILESPDTALQATRSPDARLFVTQLVEAIASREDSRSASVRTSEKLLLNLTDCRLLTGLSDANLRDAVKAGTLKAKIIGRGYKIKRTDLDSFIHQL
jgi:excisionase family DNA binding protein